MPTIKNPAKKTARKPKPLRLQGVGIQLGKDKLAELFYITFTAKQLADLLRDRGLSIPAMKNEAAARLAAWAVREEARFDLFLS